MVCLRLTLSRVLPGPDSPASATVDTDQADQRDHPHQHGLRSAGSASDPHGHVRPGHRRIQRIVRPTGHSGIGRIDRRHTRRIHSHHVGATLILVRRYGNQVPSRSDLQVDLLVAAILFRCGQQLAVGIEDKKIQIALRT